VFLFGPVGDRVIGALALALSVVLFLPIPFVNFAPGLAIVLLALALLQHDGLAALLGLAAAALTVVLLVAISGALWVAVQAFFAALFG
jgi:hypothetical protein